MLVLAMQFSRGSWGVAPRAQQRPRRSGGEVERTFRAEQRTERSPRIGCGEERTYQPQQMLEDPASTCFNLGIPFSE